MFERRIQNQLHEWAEKNNRKPLILRGARQVGKTTIVEQFGKEFDNFLSLNLEKKEAKDLFESTQPTYSSKSTLRFVELLANTTACSPGERVIVSAFNVENFTFPCTRVV